VDSYSDYIIAHDPTGQAPHGIYVAQIDHSDDGVGRFISRAQVAANAHRICAAVNACEGITTEALEQGVVAELMDQLTFLVRWAEDQGEECRFARAALAKAKGRPA
jgi:hypothetical protein